MSRTRRGAIVRTYAGRWRYVDKSALKQRAREGRRAIDRSILLRARNGDPDIPKTTRNAECEDRWRHD
jgi:hypothetical protein